LLKRHIPKVLVRRRRLKGTTANLPWIYLGPCQRSSLFYRPGSVPSWTCHWTEDCWV